jgi:hypothetical protein
MSPKDVDKSEHQVYNRNDSIRRRVATSDGKQGGDYEVTEN